MNAGDSLKFHNTPEDEDDPDYDGYYLDPGDIIDLSDDDVLEEVAETFGISISELLEEEDVFFTDDVRDEM